MIVKYKPETKLYSIEEITQEDLELLQGGLIELREKKLQDEQLFHKQRVECAIMFHLIDNVLLK